MFADIRVCLSLLSPEARWRWLALLPLALAAAAAEAVGAGAAFGLISILGDPARGWELPSPDVLALALPEGVLAPGRTARGFVYFERPPRGVAQATLTLRLVDADGEPLGVVAIPLALR